MEITDVAVQDAGYPEGFSTHLYTVKDYLLNIGITHELDFAARPVQHHHVMGLLETMKSGKFSMQVSHFAIVRKHATKDLFWLVDGRHRKSALLKGALEQSTSKGPWNGFDFHSAIKQSRAQLWERKDGNPMNGMEMLAISNHVNDVSSTVLKPSFGDRMFSACSAIKIFQNDREKTDFKDTGIGKMVDLMVKRRILGNIEDKQVRRYMSVAVMLEKSEKCKSRLKDLVPSQRSEEDLSLGAGIALTHVQSSVLQRECDDVDFGVALLGIGHILRKRRKGDGKFETIRECFYQEVKALTDIVRKVAAHKNMSVEDVLRLHESTDKANDDEEWEMDEVQTVEDVIARTVSSITEKSMNRSQSKQARRRVVSTKLVDILGRPLLVEVFGETLPGEKVPVVRKVATTDRTLRHAALRKKPDFLNVDNSKQIVALSSRPSKKRKVSGKSRKLIVVDDDEDGEDLENVKEMQEKAKALQVSGYEVEGLTKNRAAPASPSRTETAPLNEVSEGEVDREAAGEQRAEETDESSQEEGGQNIDVEFVNVDAGLCNGNPRMEFAYKFDDNLVHNEPTTQEDHVQVQPGSEAEKKLWRMLVHGSFGNDADWETAPKDMSVLGGLLHLPREHMFHKEFIDVGIFRRSKDALYWLAARAYLLDNPIECTCGKNHSSVNRNNVDICVEKYAFGEMYLSGKRGELESAGYCVLKYMLLDNGVEAGNLPRLLDKNSRQKPKEYIYAVLNGLIGDLHTSISFSSASADGRDPGNAWNWHRIRGTGREDREGIWMTGTPADVEYAKDKDGGHISVVKWLLDMWLGHVFAALKGSPNVSEGERLYMPKSGGRVIAATEKCGKQALHIDEWAEDDNVGYFCVCAFQTPVTVSIVEGSHRNVKMVPSEKLRDLGRGSVEKKVVVPRYSVLFGRADLIHAEFGMEDIERKLDIYQTVRYITYFSRRPFHESARMEVMADFQSCIQGESK